jgi:hypothetical protein
LPDGFIAKAPAAAPSLSSKEVEMSERESSGEELIDDEGRNPTQQSLDEDGPPDTVVDADWAEEGETHG